MPAPKKTGDGLGEDSTAHLIITVCSLAMSVAVFFYYLYKLLASAAATPDPKKVKAQNGKASPANRSPRLADQPVAPQRFGQPRGGGGSESHTPSSAAASSRQRTPMSASGRPQQQPSRADERRSSEAALRMFLEQEASVRGAKDLAGLEDSLASAMQRIRERRALLEKQEVPPEELLPEDDGEEDYEEEEEEEEEEPPAARPVAEKPLNGGVSEGLRKRK